MRTSFVRGVLGVMVASVSAGGCSCGKKDAPAEGTATSSASTAPSSVAASTNPAIFSAPIAAARLEGGAVIAAGLVVATKSITAQRIEADGRIAWSRELIRDVAWSQDAELKAYPMKSGAAIVWRGVRDAKNAKVLAPIGADGKSLEAPIDVGALACATDDGAAWNETVPGGKTRIHLRTWAGGAPQDALGAPIEDDVTLICGAHRAFAVSEGDDEADSPPRAFALPDAPGLSRVLGADAFPSHDEQRDLFPFTDGDDLGVVRISTQGHVQVADMQGGKPVHLAGKGRIPDDDDIVAIDADSHAVYVFYTHDESDGCKDERGGVSVHAFRIPRDGSAAGSLSIARAECGKDVGPFWTGNAADALVLAWAERAPRPGKTAAPITALAYRVMDGKSDMKRTAQSADALVDAGCASGRCYAVALAREAGADGMQPEAARVLVFP